MTLWVSLVFLGAAALEVAGDALVRHGVRGHGWIFIVAGCLTLAGYGLVVNLVKWDLSRLLGAYVAVFAFVSILVGRFALKESVSWITWVGLGFIIFGGLVIQLGEGAR
jgi:small multidrug resistance family-3 protein